MKCYVCDVGGVYIFIYYWLLYTAHMCKYLGAVCSIGDVGGALM